MGQSLSRDQKIDWLQLCRSGGIGPQTFFKLLGRFGSAGRALEELPRLAREAGGEERWRRCRRDDAAAELAAIAELGCALIAHGEPAYPQRLAEIADPPPLLIVRGDADLLAAPAVAVVGARNASANGRMLANELASHGLLVVSGLARGIDAAAHEGALAAGAPTIAVIASGVDVAYPSENAELMERIAATGAIVSERPLGAVPQARHFPRRNRLISGLCLGIVVVEAAPQSGSLITARHADDSAGSQRREAGRPAGCRAQDARLAAAAAEESGADGTDLLGRLCERLGPEPLLVDELIRQCQASTAEVQRALRELELDGRLERHPGNRVSLAAS
jgi:DNA processing protein